MKSLARQVHRKPAKSEWRVQKIQEAQKKREREKREGYPTANEIPPQEMPAGEGYQIN